jgi:hypothetical protein
MGVGERVPVSGRWAFGEEPKMQPKDAVAIAKRARKLLRAGKITHRQLSIVDALLWCCRSPTSGGIVISYSGLMRLCHVARATIAEALRVLERLGVLSKIRRRVRASWRSLQATNRYVLHVPCAQSSAAERSFNNDSIEVRVQASGTAIVAATEALRRRREAVEAGLLLKKA